MGMVRWLITLGLLGGLCPLPAWGQAAKGPNILFAIADDWGAHGGAYGTPWVKTVTLDRIAKQGLLFRNAFTPMAKCAPSRAVLLTGRYPWQLEEAGNHMSYFPSKFKCWPEVLTDQGWHMGMTGKGWGPGIAKNDKGEARQMTGKPFQKRTLTPPTRSISNNDYAANFADFLDSVPKDKPWCFWCGALEPHRDYEYGSGVAKSGKKVSDIDSVPSPWPDHDIVRNDMLDYAMEVEHFDQHLQRMLDDLQRRGMLDNTLVILTSDHGMPFPRAKGYAYYHSNHIPLAIQWPKGIRQPGRVIEDFVDFADLAPTLLDVAGIPQNSAGMQPITGQSWRPIFESGQSGRVVAARDHVLVCKERTDIGRPNDVGYPIRGILRDGFLYLKNYEPDRWPAGNPETGYLDTDGGPTKTHILELGRLDRKNRFWQWNFGMRPGEELYDLKADPGCTSNLADDPRQLTRKDQMHQQMTDKLRAQGDPRMSGHGDVFDGYPVTNNAGFYERWQRGEKVSAGWVNPTDFEPRSISPR
jgi:arylsulfatase A-like enzyme